MSPALAASLDALATRYAAHDSQALEEWLTRLARPLISQFTESTKDQETAVELALVTFARLHQERRERRERGALAWLMGVAEDVLQEERTRRSASEPWSLSSACMSAEIELLDSTDRAREIEQNWPSIASLFPVLAADLSWQRALRTARPIWAIAGVLVAFATAFVLATGQRGPVLGWLGLDCMTEIAFVGTGSYILASALMVVTKRPHAAPWLATIAGLGAMAASAWRLFRCAGAGSWPHSLLFHVGGIAVAVLLGASSSVRLLRTARE